MKKDLLMIIFKFLISFLLFIVMFGIVLPMLAEETFLCIFGGVITLFIIAEIFLSMEINIIQLFIKKE